VPAIAGRDRTGADSGTSSLSGTDWSWISCVGLRNFRNYSSAEFELGAGTVVVHGPTGAGKTNLLEAIHFACTGKSCRSANDRDLVKFGEKAAHAAVTYDGDRFSHIFETSFATGQPKLMKLDGAVADRAAAEEARPQLFVFLPDRLELVKGAAKLRREHFDAFFETLWPARRETRRSYVRALAQRNALLGRVRSGSSSRQSLSGWNHELARHGMELMKHRGAVVELLDPRFTERANELGLEGEARMTYKPRSRASSVDELEAEFEAAIDGDLERGYTMHGPHRDDVGFSFGSRDLRRFGSQGQQRLGLLALILSERDVFISTRGKTAVLLLDDVLSELDALRRGRLFDALGAGGQALLTTAEPAVAATAPGSVFEIPIDEDVLGG
jgi:DNA replication and repair protein RecF